MTQPGRDRSLAIFSGIFAVIGLTLLGYWAMETISATRFQNRQSHAFEQHPPTNQPFRNGLRSGLPPESVRPIEGSDVARLTIPDIGMAVTVVEGTSANDLSIGPGHIPTTPLPGEPGNVGIAGHRDTVFRPLRLIRTGQRVTLTTGRRQDQYRVVSTAIVDPTDIQVLRPTGKDTLTLVTCYPFRFIGPAPKRFVVRADRHP